MSNNHTLTPEQWAQIPPVCCYAAIDLRGDVIAFDLEPVKGFETWNRRPGWRCLRIYCWNIGGECPDWKNSLQQRPQMNEQPKTAQTPAVTNVRLSMPDFERVAKDFNLNVRHCETYCDAAMYSPAGNVSIIFVADVPVNITVHDSVNGIPVTVHDQI